MSYGVGLEFSDPGKAAHAAQLLRKAGLTRIESYGPFPVDEIEEALAERPSRIPMIALIGGITGGASAYGLEYYTAVVQYPLNIGGRPLHSWPAFIPVTFELTVLFAACAIVVGFLFITRLPRLHHPVFAIPGFEHASDNLFYLCIEKADPRFDFVNAQNLIATVGAEEIYEIP